MTTYKQTETKAYINTTASITSLGHGDDWLFDAICEKKSGITKDISFFPENSYAIGYIKSKHSFEESLISLCKEILENSDLEDFASTLLVVGSSVGGMKNSENSFLANGDYGKIGLLENTIVNISLMLKKVFDFYDHISFSTACTSSTVALGYAYETIKKGLYKNVLVVGADPLCRLTVGGFASLGILSKEICKPFDIDRDGINVGEGIGMLLVQDRALEREAIELCGVGYSSDAYHITQPAPDGKGALLAMKRALLVSGLRPTDIDYINAHGTGTQANDSAEAKAISALFGDKPTGIAYVSSTKSATGHTLGASGAIEAIISKLAINRQTIPPNINLNTKESNELNLPTEALSREIRYVMSNSFAFGGNNAVLILGKAGGL